MKHNLQQYLDACIARFDNPPQASISWASEHQLKEAFGFPVWAGCSPETRCIAISDELEHAPKYVIDYLVTHEYLHLVYPTDSHSHRFKVAEQAHPEYVRANRWLHVLGNKTNVKRTGVSRRSWMWIHVYSDIYGGDYAAYKKAIRGA